VTFHPKKIEMKNAIPLFVGHTVPSGMHEKRAHSKMEREKKGRKDPTALKSTNL